MPKWDKTRNYYADLELPPTASVDDIKKQFKKLALKYHPDRNPGREAEVNPKFQVIQSAHEILIDDTLKRQYDEARRSYTVRVPTASGMRGNPWQDAAKNYPPPPQRRPAARPASGAQRYESFTNSMPRPPRPPPRDDTSTRRSNAEAWENMRSSHSARRPPPTPGRAPTSATRDHKTSSAAPPPTPPRTAYQKQKAQASFGNSTRRAGFTPHSPNVADEPSVTNKNYHTTRTHSYLFTDAKDSGESDDHIPSANTGPFSHSQESFADGRQSTPYHTPGGEKTSLFGSGAGLGRTTSTRTPPRKAEMPGTFPRTRPRASSTSSTKGPSNHGSSEDSANFPTGPNSHTQSRPSSRYQPQSYPTGNGARVNPMTGNASEPTSSNASNGSGINMSSAKPDQTNGAGPSLYATQNDSPSLSPPLQSRRTREASSSYRLPKVGESTRLRRRLADEVATPPSSEDRATYSSSFLFPIEEVQRSTIDRLVSNNYMMLHKEALAKQASKASCVEKDAKVKPQADSNRQTSFDFSAENAASTKPFARNSAESINTRFVQDDHPDEWQFKAGTASAGDASTSTKTRTPSRSRVTRRQTQRARTASTNPMPAAQEAPEDAAKMGFAAKDWNEQIGSQHFEPQPTHSASSSPTRRPTTKKTSKPVKMTAGTAGMVDSEDSEGWQEISRPPNSARPSTDAMDIDSPAPENVEENPKTAQANIARKIPVEPHRAEWRAGHVDGGFSKSEGAGTDSLPAKTQVAKDQAASEPAPGNPFASVSGGSEDTDTFHTNFADFTKVEPFAEPKSTGLKSFADLKANLPFQSQPSETIPLNRSGAPDGPLEFPTPPVAPRLPPLMPRPTVSHFRKYSQDFYLYMDKWQEFNQKVVNHFSTRQTLLEQRRLQRGKSWLDMDATSDGAYDYVKELDQDQLVRSQWLKACADHQKQVNEFREFRDRFK
ncbi:hypothetical protein F5Y15DRAFT_299745 [Xylariaceae sp. FL0016]|nr:hypothetical protein F5Y15DRAFT_299745 [Xylariaceae sp. FL0016]